MSIGGNVVRTTNDLDETLVLNMFKQGNISTKIAKILHVHPNKIAAILKKNNIVIAIAIVFCLLVITILSKSILST